MNGFICCKVWLFAGMKSSDGLGEETVCPTLYVQPPALWQAVQVLTGVGTVLIYMPRSAETPRAGEVSSFKFLSFKFISFI